MEYKGYFSTKVVLDEDANIFHGSVINLDDLITFEANNADELKEEFENSVDEYLDFCSSRDRDPEKPYSGRLNLRLKPELHRELSILAGSSDTSMNNLIVEILSDCIYTLKPEKHDVIAEKQMANPRLNG